MRDFSDNEEYNQLQKDFQRVDQAYRNAKSDIEWSRNVDEQKYWTKRADDLWQERDALDYKLATFGKNNSDTQAPPEINDSGENEETKESEEDKDSEE